MPSKKKSPFRKVVTAFLLLLLAGSALMTWEFYQVVFAPNVKVKDSDEPFVYIPTGASFTDVVNILVGKKVIINRTSFEWLAEILKYKQNIHPGRYRIREGMNNKELILLLRSGKQTPVKLTLNYIRLKTDLAGVVSQNLEIDSASFLELINEDERLKPYGLDAENSLSLFLPNTYEFYWNTSAEKFIEKMGKEYNKFWTEDRKTKAKKIGLSAAEVGVLASIVEQETRKNDEKDEVAGVYMNRMKKGWKLEADPTLVYALGDFTVRRVLRAYKEIDSPYNTYMYEGLPPGPICMPSLSSIDAVLNYNKHDYMFFCASVDTPGYHCFAKTYDQHKVNARKFQKELNKRNIRS